MSVCVSVHTHVLASSLIRGRKLRHHQDVRSSRDVIPLSLSLLPTLHERARELTTSVVSLLRHTRHTVTGTQGCSDETARQPFVFRLSSCILRLRNQVIALSRAKRETDPKDAQLHANEPVGQSALLSLSHFHSLISFLFLSFIPSHHEQQVPAASLSR